MTPLKFYIPYPPSVNHLYDFRGRTKFIGEKGKLFFSEVSELAMYWKIQKRISCQIKMDIKVFLPDKRKRDIDNVLKATFDSLQKSNIIEDDRLICQLMIEKVGIDRKKPRLEIEIAEYNKELSNG